MNGNGVSIYVDNFENYIQKLENERAKKMTNRTSSRFVNIKIFKFKDNFYKILKK